ANVLRNLQMSEIFVTELVLSGLLEEMDDPTLFGVMCAVVATFPRKAQRRYGMDKRTRQLARDIESVRHSAPVVDAEAITEMEVEFSPAWIELGRAWVAGDSFTTVLGMVDSETDIAGDVVGAFRRAKDLCKQLAEVYRDLPERSEALRHLSKRVSRDEVEVVG
ncbi:MAG: hypothetical protein AB8H79_03240, partial [Myxococcota bacterium]